MGVGLPWGLFCWYCHADHGRQPGPARRLVGCASDFPQGGWDEPDFLPCRHGSTFVVASGRYRRCPFAARTARSPGGAASTSIATRSISPSPATRARPVCSQSMYPRQRLIRSPDDPPGNSLGRRSCPALGRRRRKPAVTQPAAVRAAQYVLVRPRRLVSSARQIVYGLLCAPDGCPVAIEVLDGKTADPMTLT
jgi:hypothetical protein